MLLLDCHKWLGYTLPFFRASVAKMWWYNYFLCTNFQADYHAIKTIFHKNKRLYETDHAHILSWSFEYRHGKFNDLILLQCKKEKRLSELSRKCVIFKSCCVIKTFIDSSNVQCTTNPKLDLRVSCMSISHRWTYPWLCVLFVRWTIWTIYCLL